MELDIKNVLFISTILFILCFAQKIEDGEYNNKKSDEILAIAEQYFKIKDAKEKREISILIKNLSKVSK